MNLGPLEIVVILVVALLVFGPKRLPEVGRQVGGALREIRKVQDTVRSEINAVINAEPAHAPAAARSKVAPVRDDEPDHDEAADEGLEPPPTDPADPGSGFDGPPGSFS